MRKTERRGEKRNDASRFLDLRQVKLRFPFPRCVAFPFGLYSRRCFKRAPSREAIGLEKKLKGKRKRERESYIELEEREETGSIEEVEEAVGLFFGRTRE